MRFDQGREEMWQNSDARTTPRCRKKSVRSLHGNRNSVINFSSTLFEFQKEMQEERREMRRKIERRIQTTEDIFKQVIHSLTRPSRPISCKRQIDIAFPFWATAPMRSMLYAFTHLRDFLLLFSLLLVQRPPPNSAKFCLILPNSA